MSLMPPFSAWPSIDAMAPEKIHGWRWRTGLSRPCFKITCPMAASPAPALPARQSVPRGPPILPAPPRFYNHGPVR